MKEISKGFKKLFEMKFFIHQRSMLLKIILSYIIIGAMLITFLSSMLFTRFSDTSIQEISDASVKSLGQSVRACDTLWTTTYKTMFKEYTTNSILINAISMTDISPYDYEEISRKLREIVSSNNLIFSVYAYNSTANLIFSTVGPVENRESFVDKDIVQFMENSKAKVSRITQSTIYYRKLEYTYNGNYQNRNVISVIFSNDDFESGLIFNIDQGVIQSIITPEKTENGLNVLIINNNGIVISHSTTEKIYKNIVEQKYVQNILSSRHKYGYFTDNVDGNKSLITFNKWDKWNQWDNLGWNFVCINDYNVMLQNVNQLKKSVFIITALFVLISILIAGFFTRNIYIPFYKLLSRIKSKGITVNNDKKINEYDYLKNVYDSMLDDLESLRMYKNSSTMAVKKEFFDRILSGSMIETSDLKEQITQYSISLNAQRFCVVVIRIDNMKELTKKHSTEELALLRFAVCNISEELFGAQYEVEALERGEDNIVVIINIYEQKDEDATVISKVIADVQAASQHFLELSLTAGLGSVEETLNGLFYSYKKACDAAEYRLVFGKKSILDYTKICIRRQGEHEYPFELEKVLIEAIRAADSEKANNALLLFIETISQYSYSEILVALNQLNLVTFRMFRTVLEVDEMDKMNYNLDFKEFNNNFGSFETIEEIQEWFIKVFTSGMLAIKKKKENKYEDIVVRIQKYIEENYSNPDITVELLSDIVGLSTNYTRTIFKESTGVSLSGYINDIRIEKSKEYLLNTDYPVSRVAEVTGIPSSYFYKAFKKAVGVSPDEFRKRKR